MCQKKQCLFPKPCKNLRVDHRDYLNLLRKLRSLPNVKKVFIRSGIRFDYLIYDKDETFFKELVEHHVSGQLKVAPEHVAEPVLRRMGKPEPSVYKRFVREYEKMNERLGMKQYLVPYLMSSHPGSSLKEAVELAEYLRDIHYMPEQVQDFYPTPSTVSTCMFYTGLDPRNMEPVYVPVNPHEKAMQRALMQYRKPNNYELVREALIKAGRTDLIGFGPQCLIRPRQGDFRNASGFRKADGIRNAEGFRGTGGSRKADRTQNAEGFRGADGFRRTDVSGNPPFRKGQKPVKKRTIRNVHKSPKERGAGS